MTTQPAAPSAQSAAPKRRVEIYDTTLRDGTQGEGVSLSLVDKLKITQHLDSIGVDYVEGGYPLSNPKDAAYFTEVQKLTLKHARVCAFGMTRRKGVAPAEDPGMRALLDANTPVVTIVGKTSVLHVDEVLRVSREENLAMIQESLAYLTSQGREVFYDAEHFFDGYRLNPEYAFKTLEAALAGGATRLILCDTNGGSLPTWVTQVVNHVTATFPNAKLGIHPHNDSGLAVANSLAAVDAGAVQVQGTINGIGERCGNVDLTTVVGNLRLKMNIDCLFADSLSRLTDTSRLVYEQANLNLAPGQPYVGSSAFAHKGGMHVSAVQRIAHSYEHVDPALVGNSRKVLVSELSGMSNIVATVGAKFGIADRKDLQKQIVEQVAAMEHQGYQFEAANASFELLVHGVLGTKPAFWNVDHYRITINKRDGEKPTTEATVKLVINGKTEHHVAEGDGPVNALDGAIRKCVEPHFPQLKNVHLRDFKVRVVNPTAESAAKVRVIADFAVHGKDGAGASTYFATIGVNENIVEASWQAITDALVFHLIESKKG